MLFLYWFLIIQNGIMPPCLRQFQLIHVVVLRKGKKKKHGSVGDGKQAFVA